MNAHSLRYKIIPLEALIQLHSVDLVFLTETWLPEKFNPVISNFKLIASCHRQDTTAGHSGGAAIFVRCCENIHVNYNRTFHPSQDCQVVQAMINQVTFVCIYRSPSQKKQDLDKLTLFIKSLKEFPNIIVLGDLNIPTAKWSYMTTSDPEHQELVTSFAELNLWNYVEDATHVRGNVLDLILAENNLVSDVEVDSHSIFKSDHYPILFTVENLQTESTIKLMHKRYELFDKDKFITLLRGYAWTLLDYSRIDTSVEQITRIIVDSYNVCLPTSNVVKSRDLRRLSSETSAQIGLVKHLKKNHARTPFLVQAEEKLKTMLVKDNIRWNEQYMKYLAKNRNNIYATMSKKHFEKRILCTRKPNGSLTYDSQEIADILATQYASVFLISGTPNIDWEDENGAILCDIEITREKIDRVIRKTRRSNGVGPDGLSTAMFKDSADALLLPLEVLFRQILRTGTVPAAFRIAHVTPLPKKLDSTYAAHTRGINIESVFGKLLEKLVSNEMMDALENAEYFPENQYGFRRGRGCEGNLDKFHDYLHKNLDEGWSIAVCFADLSKAFDLCDQALVLQAVFDSGIRGKIGLYIENWLKNRRQCVKFNDKLSKMCDVTSSIVQGSNLGPMLFLLLKKDLNAYIKYSFVLDYADDTKIILRYKQRSDLWMLQSDIEGLFKWSQVKRQKLNLEKTVVLNFGGRLPRNMLFVNNYPLKVVEEICDLGLTINSATGWKSHHEQVLKKMRVAVYSAKLTAKAANFTTRCDIWLIYLRAVYQFSSSSWADSVIAERLDQLWISFFEDSKPEAHEVIPLPPSAELLFLDLKKLTKIRQKCKSLHEWHLAVGDMRINNLTNHEMRSMTGSNCHIYYHAKPLVKHQWPSSSIFRRTEVDWNNFIRCRYPWTDSGLRKYVLSAESSAQRGVELHERLKAHNLLSWRQRKKKRELKLKKINLDQCEQSDISNDHTLTMSHYSFDSEVEVLQDDHNIGSHRFLNGSRSRNQNEENNNVPLVNGDLAGLPLGNEAAGHAQVHGDAPNPDQQQPPDINENNDRLLQLAVDFTDRVDEGEVLHDDTVQEATQDVRHHLDILRNGRDDRDYLTSRQALHEIQAGRTRQVLEIAIAGLPQPIDEMTLTALRSIVESVMQSLTTAE